MQFILERNTIWQRDSVYFVRYCKFIELYAVALELLSMKTLKECDFKRNRFFFELLSLNSDDWHENWTWMGMTNLSFRNPQSSQPLVELIHFSSCIFLIFANAKIKIHTQNREELTTYFINLSDRILFVTLLIKLKLLREAIQDWY